MIGSLRGTLLDVSPGGEVLLEAGGVGYRVVVTADTLATLGEAGGSSGGSSGGNTFLFVHHHIREDAQVLYGFRSLAERACFEALLGAHGVGPSLALAIMSVHTPAELQRAVADHDVAALCLVPGVGKKTAARLLVELGQRLDGIAPAPAPSPGAPPGPAEGDRRSDVRAALAELGYDADEVRLVLRDVGDGTTEEMLRDALQRLSMASR